MALLQFHYVSNALKRTVTAMAVLPVDKITDGAYPEKRHYKTLYLLHGLLGNCTDWTCFTRIQQLAEKADLAVIMPSGDNSFYVDQLLPNNDYGSFIGEELVSVTRNMFPLSDKREDTYIGGLSMGGFGALRNGLKYHETFSRIISLSPALNMFEIPVGTPGRVLFHEDAVFGDLKTARHTDKNPRFLLNQLQAKKAADPAVHLPAVYLTCGRQDSLYDCSMQFAEDLKAAGLCVDGQSTDGQHDWDFWNVEIVKALEWLPLDAGNTGLNSGHVTVS